MRWTGRLFSWLVVMTASYTWAVGQTGLDDINRHLCELWARTAPWPLPSCEFHKYLPYAWGVGLIAAIFFLSFDFWRIIKAALVKLNSRSESARAVKPYLHDEDTELGGAIRDMARYSAWAKWFASQFLANNNHAPVSQPNLMNIASGIVLDALMDGKILARGRPQWISRALWRRQPSDPIEYEDISREAWRLAAIRMEPHPNTLWRAVLFPRSNVDPERIKKLLDYDSVIVNSREFEKLWRE
jgi:hypothetical protein